MSLSFGQALIVYFILPVLLILKITIVVNVILSWLVSFNVVNPHNQLVNTIWRLTSTITEPLLGPIRRFIPSLGGLDFSPIVLLLLLQFLDAWFFRDFLFRLL